MTREMLLKTIARPAIRWLSGSDDAPARGAAQRMAHEAREAERRRFAGRSERVDLLRPGGS